MTRQRSVTSGLLTLVVLAAVAVLAYAGTRALATDDGPAVSRLDPVVAAQAARPGALDPAALFANRVAGVVTVRSTWSGGSPMTGAGFVADADGNILTASHVVVQYPDGNPVGVAASFVKVSFRAGDEVQAKLVGYDRFNDVALLRIDPAQVRNLTSLPLGDSDQLVVGSEIAAIGAPFEMNDTMTTGIISQTRRVQNSLVGGGTYSLPEAIQVDAAINPGNSGGPLFDAAGNVIGIIQQISTKAGQNSGVGFAVPINLALGSMEQLLAGQTIQLPRMGIADTHTLSPQLARSLDVPLDHGAIVTATDPDGPAEDAGISADGRSVTWLNETIIVGDIIVAIDGEPVRVSEDVNRLAARLTVGQPAEVEFYDGSRRRTTTIVPEART